MIVDTLVGQLTPQLIDITLIVQMDNVVNNA